MDIATLTLFSPEAAAVDRQIMAGHWESPEGDDFEASERAFWPQCFGTPPPAREIKAGPKRRRMRPSVKEDILTLRGRGMVPTAIADVLNLSDRRVREVLKEAEKRLEQAGEMTPHEK